MPVTSNITPQLVAEKPIFNYYQVHDFKKDSNIKRLKQIINRDNSMVNNVIDNMSGLQ